MIPVAWLKTACAWAAPGKASYPRLTNGGHRRRKPAAQVQALKQLAESPEELHQRQRQAARSGPPRNAKRGG